MEKDSRERKKRKKRKMGFSLVRKGSFFAGAKRDREGKYATKVN